MRRVTHDFETRSACDLKSAGAYIYSMHPTTKPTCLAFKIHGKPTIYFLDFYLVNTPWAKLPKMLRTLWSSFIDEGFEFSAHNSFFEKCIYDNILVRRYGWPVIPQTLRRCTAAKAAACALPRNLEGAGSALNLDVQKDKRGYVAMMATCKPTKRWNDWTKARMQVASGKTIRERRYKLSCEDEPPMFLEPDAAPDVWKTLYTYCKYDVLSEEALDIRLPDLIPSEQEIWHLNQKLNWRGVYVDTKTISKIVTIMEAESTTRLKELDALTMGLVTKPGARKSILEFLALDGVELPDIRATTVDDALKGGKLNPDMQKLLELRKALSKSSTKKYAGFLKRASKDNRVRDLILYHGASTGRDSGTGIQIQNFPRGLIKVDKARPYAAVENVVECDAEFLKILYGQDLSILFSALLRNMICASPGRELFAADFSKIEVAVLWWAAENRPGLRILKDGKDPYKYQAAMNMNRAYEEIADEGDDRQLGKAQVLGCGFGMGWKKFQQTAWDVYRLKLTDEQSKKAVKAYREANAAVPELWRAYEDAAIKAVECSNGDSYFAGQCSFQVREGFLWSRLPSGRSLAYAEPRIAWRMREFEVEETIIDEDGTERKVTKKEIKGPYKTLEFMAVNSKTKKWSLERTWGGTLTENMVQAMARDLMMSALVRLEKSDYRVMFAVHDEGVCEREIGQGSVEEFTRIMTRPPKWAAGLPIEAKGYVASRYRK